jgi:hypothetical protein
METQRVWEAIKRMSERQIAFQRAFVELTGSVASALFLSQACFWAKTKDWGRFWKTQEEWERETGLSRREQESARKALRKLGVLEEKLEGIPPRLYYQVKIEVLADLLVPETPSQYGGKRQIEMAENAKLYKEAEMSSEMSSEMINNTQGIPAKEAGTSGDQTSESKSSKAKPENQPIHEPISIAKRPRPVLSPEDWERVLALAAEFEMMVILTKQTNTLLAELACDCRTLDYLREVLEAAITRSGDDTPSVERDRQILFTARELMQMGAA